MSVEKDGACLYVGGLSLNRFLVHVGLHQLLSHFFGLVGP